MDLASPAVSGTSVYANGLRCTVQIRLMIPDLYHANTHVDHFPLVYLVQRRKDFITHVCPKYFM